MDEKADSGPERSVWWWVFLAFIAVAAVAVAARVSVPIPGTPVPQSLQTLAVLVVGALLGLRWGTLAMVLYVLLGTVGLPVFADGAGGAEHLRGPTAGYLVGFVAGAALVGWWKARGWTEAFLPAFGGMVAGHFVILVLGWARLATIAGVAGAFGAGVAPFLVGGLVKSAVGAGLVMLVARIGS